MSTYLLGSDDSDDASDSNVEMKTYTPKEMNIILLNKTTKIADNFKNINMIGDIVGCKKWKRSGMGFKLMNNEESFECKVWIKDGCDLNKVQKYANMNCKITGNIIAEYFYSHKFVFNVTDIELETDDTKLKGLKEQCKEKGYFENKKNIYWDNIKKIGIISKANTQGYNDFIKQLKIPVSIITKEITLEGKNTSNLCIQSIGELQDVDIIMIIRGGGDTSEISNSFDTIELFEAIHKSDVPIITAIGHEADTGDKLLITGVSDHDFPTPSTASIEITKILLNPIIKKLENELSKIESLIIGKLNEEYDRVYHVLRCLFENYKNEKFGGQIIKLRDDSSHFIIIERNGHLYNIPINFDNKLDFTTDEVIKCENIDNAINNHDILIIQKYFADIAVESINDQIKEVLKIHKMEDSFKKVKPKKIIKLYCREYDINGLTIQKLIQLYGMVQWYKTSLEGEEDFKEVFNYYC